jgi:hypothetical protein
MAQPASARRIGPVAPPAPRLATVHRLPAAPAVLWRRRLVALGALALLGLLAVAALRIGAGGGQPAGVDVVLGRLAARPAALCDAMSARLAAATGGRAACLRASPARGPRARVSAVRVAGPVATALLAAGGDRQRVRLVRERGAWRVDGVG